MKKVSIYRPSTVDEAIQILSQHGTERVRVRRRHGPAVRLKNRLEQAPSYLVDIKKIDHLRYIKEDAQGGVEIGAATKLAELADSSLLQDKYPMLVEAILKISSPELRNASTLGGDLLQEVWCQYLRGGYSCWRNGGYICYGAIGDNSYYHSAMGGRLCYAVYPGDAATALIPFDARAKLATPQGVKELVDRTTGARRHAGGRQNPVARRALQRDSDFGGYPSAEARRAGVVREAPASRSVGFRHGLAGDQSSASRQDD